MWSQVVWHSRGYWPAAVAAAVGIVLAVAWLYPGQVRAVRGAWRWALPGLRAAGMLALAASLLKPVAARPKGVEEQGAVVVLVDCSRSMGVVDVSRTTAERVALADGLGMLPAGARQDVNQGVQEELDRLGSLVEEVMKAQRELEYARLSGPRAQAAEQRVQKTIEQFREAAERLAARGKEVAGAAGPALAQLAKMPDPRAEGGQLRPAAQREQWATRQVQPRIRLAADAVKGMQAAADEALYRSNAAVRQACDEVGKWSRFELAEQAVTRRRTGLLARLPAEAEVFGFGFAGDVVPLPLRGAGGGKVRQFVLRPDGSSSDVTGAVPAALAAVRGGGAGPGEAPRAVVLLSDGRQVGGNDVVPSGLSASGVPVFAVAVTPPPERVTPDVSFVGVSAPAGAFVGETIVVRAKVGHAGVKAGRCDVQLAGAGGEQVRTVSLADGAAAAPVEFQVKLEHPGAQRLVLSVKPVPGEISTENNQVERWVKVLSDKTRVEMIAGWPGWDFQYIRDALSRTGSVALRDAVVQGEAKLGLTAEQILGFDLLILSDVPVSPLSEGQWDAVVQRVKDRGGSVIVLAGDATVPRQYAQHLLLRDLLPFRSDAAPVWRSWPGKEAFYHLVPGEVGSGTWDVGSGEGGPGLPGIYGYLAIGPLKPNVQRVLLMERDSRAPVLTESRLGLGRVFFFGADETWRWRQGEVGSGKGETDQDRFWLQLVRYAAEEPYAARTGRVALDAERVSVGPGEPLRVRARVSEADGSPAKAPGQQVRLVQGRTVVRTEAMSAAGAAGSGRYEATISDLPVGEYELQLSPAAGEAPAVLAVRVAKSDEQELADLSPDYAKLRRLAESSEGGELLGVEQLPRLPERLRELSDRDGQMAEYPLWDSGYLFLFVLACLGAEWALRKRFGLA